MKASYSYTILRYVHDIVAGEFVNLGVILYSPQAAFLGARISTSVSRVKRFFGRVDSDHLRDTLRHIEREIGNIERRGEASSLLMEVDALTFAERIVPRDDSALQFSPVGAGVTDEPQIALERLFDRYVNRYRGLPKSTRHDQDILPIFKKPLEERNLLSHVQPKVIESPDYQHEFPLAWKNGLWNACDAVSFDLSEAGDIIEKANKWMGRAWNLHESSEKFRLVLLLGEPRRSELDPVVARAEHIIRKAPLEIVMVRERDAKRLAEMIEKDIVN